MERKNTNKKKRNNTNLCIQTNEDTEKFSLAWHGEYINSGSFKNVATICM